MTEQKLKAIMTDIAHMDENQLQDIGEEFSRSTIDDKTKFYVYESIDKRREKIRNLEELQGASVVTSELREGEI